jgi:hypothetical protein
VDGIRLAIPAGHADTFARAKIDRSQLVCGTNDEIPDQSGQFVARY